MNTTIRSITTAALATLLLAGCDVAGLDEDWGRRPAQVLVGIDGPAISAPDTVRTGVPFDVQITTGGAGCLRRGETQAHVDQQLRKAELFPFDYELSGARLCTADLKRFEHEVRVAFDTPGTATIAVHSAGADGVPTFAPVIHARIVQVVP